ncbi:ubiquinone biosynthesis O-methyltransferase [Phanerochaete sordida]|uniref:Ubiquinone biosynthesis O-methyltransferase, mitochondrial n=1 Tax=Phanerochaete sordida TaxID=48140 RepID=A0A9P3LEN8_9APHY|nr:ubiquinone biosynthesis O-methyltransferase [Phanerochaete sordida]
MALRAPLRCLRHTPYLARPLSTAGTSHTADLHAQAQARSTINDSEIAHFSRLSALWWDEQGEFQMLHRMNPVRMRFVREKLAEMALEDDGDADVTPADVLRGKDVLDVGCGGGLLSESLARMGANTLGIDASPSNVSIASLHASADPALAASTQGRRRGALAYQHTSVEDLLAARGPASFDAVCSMEVLEHVDNPRAFLDSCAQLVKPGGHLFLSTIARTPLAYLVTIAAAEHVLRRVSRGTHTYAKFVDPAELVDFFRAYRPHGRPWIASAGAPARTEAETRGMVYVPWDGEWVLAPRGAAWAEGCNYLFWVRRPRE